jgi:hypothetical protein
MNMCKHLSKIAHIDQGSAKRAVTQMVQVGLSGAIGISACITWDRQAS